MNRLVTGDKIGAVGGANVSAPAEAKGDTRRATSPRSAKCGW